MTGVARRQRRVPDVVVADAGHLTGRSVPWYRAPSALRWASLSVTIAVVMLIGTGGWVRLSGSGLGCPTWPDCTATSIIAPASYHALVEFVNRCIITCVGVLIGAVLLAAIARRPRRRDLIWLAAGLAAGYLGEAVLGGLSVLLRLAPALVAAHLVLAMALLTDAVVLHWRAGSPRRSPARSDRNLVLIADLLLAVMAIVIALGTVVTGAGPHGGSPGAARFGLRFSAAAQLHADAGFVLFGLAVATFFLLRSGRAARAVWRRYAIVIGLLAVQGCLGYATYFSHVEVNLAEAHLVVGALIVTALVRLRLGLGPAGPPGTTSQHDIKGAGSVPGWAAREASQPGWR